MANEADSRHTTHLPRWGETVAEVPNANVQEPLSPKKDVGWIPGADGLVGEWLNWLFWATGVFFRYIENYQRLMWTKPHVMAGAAAGEGAVTNGAGLSVNVAGSRVWISGAMFKVPAAVNLALDAAHATLDRVDLVVASVVTLTPAYRVITGTPAAFPEAPLPGVNEVPIAEVDVDALATSPGNKVSVREFGAIDLDTIRGTGRLIGGLIGAGNAMFEVVKAGAAWTVKIGGTADPVMLISNFGPAIFLKPLAVYFFEAIRRKYDVNAAGWQKIGDSAPGGISGLALAPYDTLGGGIWTASSGATGSLAAEVRIPNGCKIKSARIYGEKVGSPDAFLTLHFYGSAKGTGLHTLSPAEVDNDGGATGFFQLVINDIDHVVNQSLTYAMFVEFDAGAGAVRLISGEVEYEETQPWKGL